MSLRKIKKFDYHQHRCVGFNWNENKKIGKYILECWYGHIYKKTAIHLATKKYHTKAEVEFYTNWWKEGVGGCRCPECSKLRNKGVNVEKVLKHSGWHGKKEK